MKSFNHPKKIIFLAFLLSLLFHVGSLVYVAIESSFAPPSHKASEDFRKAPVNKQQNNEWVEAKARAGNFGTPVFFQDEFEAQSVETQQDESSVAKAMEDMPEDTASDKITENKPEIIETKQEDTSESQEQTKEAITEKENQIAVTPKPTATIQDTEIKPAAPKKTVPQKTAQSKPLSQTPRQLSAPKPPLTLAQLSQGFLNHVKDEGKHAIHMLGKKNGTPSDEQIKYERYLQKLSWCLQNSFNIHNDRFPASARDVDSVQVLLALNQDGSMKQCRISKTSGNRDLDYFTLFIFNDASSSFPPVPEYLPHDPFAINYIIMVSASEDNRWKLYRQ